MTLEAYLKAEFRRYFGDASYIAVLVSGEAIDVRIMGPIEQPENSFPSVSYIDNYLFEAGSDDDWYIFTNSEGTIITVPLMPEEA